MSEYSNGAYNKIGEAIKEMADKQDTIENVLVKGFNELKETMNHGHNAIADEIRKVREIGSLPIPLVEKLLDHNNSMNNKNSDKVDKVIIVFLIAALGVKTFLPQILGG